MAIQKMTEGEIITEVDTFDALPPLEIERRNTPAARRAYLKGQLVARKSAKRQATAMAWLGWPLFVAVILVSFVHLWETIGAIKPAYVGDLRISAGLHHATAGAWTAAIDAAAIYVTLANSAALLAGAKSPRRRWYSYLWGGAAPFYILTFVLNALFVIAYAPALSSTLRAGLLPALQASLIILLPGFLPVAASKIEHARRRADAARLHLLAQVEQLSEELRAFDEPQPYATQRRATSGDKPVIAPQSNKTLLPVDEDAILEGVTGGRKKNYSVDDVLVMMPAGQTMNRGDLMRAVGCGATTINNLLADAIEAGHVEKIGHGVYQRV